MQCVNFGDGTAVQIFHVAWCPQPSKIQVLRQSQQSLAIAVVFAEYFFKQHGGSVSVFGGFASLAQQQRQRQFAATERRREGEKERRREGEKERRREGEKERRRDTPKNTQQRSEAHTSYHPTTTPTTLPVQVRGQRFQTLFKQFHDGTQGRTTTTPVDAAVAGQCTGVGQTRFQQRVVRQSRQFHFAHFTQNGGFVFVFFRSPGGILSSFD